jgi:hypothetical protein
MQLNFPPYNFDLIATPSTEQKQMTRVWITRQNLLGLCCKPVEAARAMPKSW